MSIIEKAVDKLASEPEEPAGSKPVPRVTPAATVEQPVPESAAAVPQPRAGDHIPTPLEQAALTPEEIPIRFAELGLEGVLSPEGGRSRLDEEYRMIKRPLLMKAFLPVAPGENPYNLIMVTSALSGEGKTFTSMNLAISIAMEMDRTVLLVDADLAKPSLSRLLQVNDRPGFTECLRDETLDLGECILHTDVPKLRVLPAGQRHNRATELLASNSMISRLQELATRYPDRIVLFDSPPLLATSEASTLARHMGQVAMVVEYGGTPQFMIKEALGLLDSKENVSLILNKSRDDFLIKHVGGYGYGYGKGYGYGAYGDQ